METRGKEEQKKKREEKEENAPEEKESLLEGATGMVEEGKKGKHTRRKSDQKQRNTAHSGAAGSLPRLGT